MKKEEKIERALQSLDGMQQAEAAHGLYDRVLQHACSSKVVQMPVRKVVFIRAAACIILLAGINAFTLLHHSKKQQVANTSNAFVNEYFSY